MKKLLKHLSSKLDIDKNRIIIKGNEKKRSHYSNRKKK